MVGPSDDRLHPRNDDPYWNESAYFSFSVPEQRLQGWVYFYHRPNLGISAGGPVIWDHTGTEIYNCVYWDWDNCQPMPDGAEMFDFALRNTLRLETVEQGRVYHMRYDKHDCALDLTWTQVQPPHAMRRVDGQTNPSFTGYLSDAGLENPELSTGHFDQTGRIKGTVTVEGTTYDIDSFSNRDRSWGPRHVKRVRVGYSWGVVAEDHSFLAGCRNFDPLDADPMFGTTEEVMSGWYLRDGLRGHLMQGTRRLERAPEDGRPVREIIDARDEHGRDLHVVGTPVNHLRWTGYTDVIDATSLMHWDLDGVSGWGELHDYYDFRTHRGLHRRLNPRYAEAVSS